MRIVHAASEMLPYMKTGGLADVTAALTKSLASLGHDVSLFIPGYREIIDRLEYEQAKLAVVLEVELGREFHQCEVYELRIGLRQTLYVVRRDEFFDRKYAYGTPSRDYDDNDRRYIYFCKAIVKAMHTLGIKADILHCHDWQTGLAPLFLRYAEQQSGVSLAGKTFFTIHNLAFQGVFSSDSFRFTNLPEEFNCMDGLEFFEQISMIKGGIFFADKITTVSPNYAREILTTEFGYGLEGALEARSDDLVGIANGIDGELWDPSIDPALPANYDADNLDGKKKCRAALLRRFGLSATAKTPVYGMVCRLTEQKGIHFLIKELEFFVQCDCRLLVLGLGNLEFQKSLAKWARRKPQHIAVHFAMDEPLSHLIEAGSDFFLLPSTFEPCGLNQMYSQVYGTIPLASKVGGLADTVIDIDECKETGTGVCFDHTQDGLRSGLERSLKLFRNKKRMNAVRQRGMRKNFSWKDVAKEYEAKYLECV